LLKSFKRKTKFSEEEYATYLKERGPDTCVGGGGSDVTEEEDTRGEQAGGCGGQEYGVASTQIFPISRNV
jgi:hypothetical protein